jgi:hypothetical protein
MSRLAFLLVLLRLVGVAHAEAPTGILKVRSNAEGAEVWLDGAVVGKAPLTKYLPAGVHQLRVVADRFDPFVRRVELVADRTLEVQATLVPGTGTVEFTGPAGATLILGKTPRGALPIRLPSPGAGNLAWKVEAPGKEPAEGVLAVVAGRNHLVDVKLEDSAGVFVVKSRPAGAAVRLDGNDVGVTPLKLTGIPADKHVVEVRLDGHALAIRNVDTTGGKRAEIDIPLATRGGRLVVRTGRPDGAVRVNDALVGTGPEVIVDPIEAGRVRVSVDAPDLAAKAQVQVEARDSHVLRVNGADLVPVVPFTRRWVFWAGLGVAAAGGGVAAALAAVANQPAPPPDGAVVVDLP